MKTYVALLRAVNVGGKSLPMEDLRKLCADLDLANVETYLQSGNAVFDSPAAGIATLPAALETQIRKAFGFDVTVFILEPADLQRILKENPFLEQPGADLESLYVTFLQYPPAPRQWAALDGMDAAPDSFRPGEAEVFVSCPGGYGKTKLSNAFFEKKLNMPATTRNWKTVTALAQLAGRSG
jgi:uncharacterized protein (DUF1697 family)